MSKIPAASIKPKLDGLIEQATISEPKLADRLKELKQWITKVKPGLLTAKPYVLGLLSEVVQDSDFWLITQDLTAAEKAEIYDLKDTPKAERYWLDELFPLWFSERDPKSPQWKQKMMAGKFQAYDHQNIANFEQAIRTQGGSATCRYILDLAMATDVLVVHTQDGLCVQLTSQTGENLTPKARKWEETLMYWSILRGLLLSYANVEVDYQNLAKITLQHSDTLPNGSYTIIDG